jgi:hypothetical protein
LDLAHADFDNQFSKFISLECRAFCRVRKSDLWNQKHVEEIYDHAFLGSFNRLVSEMGRAA